MEGAPAGENCSTRERRARFLFGTLAVGSPSDSLSQSRAGDQLRRRAGRSKMLSDQ